MARKANRKRTKNTSGARNFARFLLVIATPILLLGIWGTAQGARTWQWPRVEAKIIDANLRTFAQRTQNAQQLDTRHSFAVRYAYTVAGRDYVGSATEPYDLGIQNSACAKRMKDRHPVGSAALIAYDPGDPAIAYLEPGPSSFAMMILGIGAIVGVVGLWVRNLARRGLGTMAGKDELV